MKNALSSADIKRAIQSSLKFSTNKISFKYVVAKTPGFVFSLSRRLGSAVERNLFKRRARYFLSKNATGNVIVFIQPKKQLKKIKNPFNHFKLFEEFLNKKNDK